MSTCTPTAWCGNTCETHSSTEDVARLRRRSSGWSSRRIPTVPRGRARGLNGIGWREVLETRYNGKRVVYVLRRSSATSDAIFGAISRTKDALPNQTRICRKAFRGKWSTYIISIFEDTPFFIFMLTPGFCRSVTRPNTRAGYSGAVLCAKTRSKNHIRSQCEQFWGFERFMTRFPSSIRVQTTANRAQFVNPFTPLNKWCSKNW